MESSEELTAALAAHDAVRDVTGPVRMALASALWSGEGLARRGFDVLTLRLGELKQANYVLDLYAAAIDAAGPPWGADYGGRVVRPLAWVISQLAGDGPSFPSLDLDWSGRLADGQGDGGIDARIRDASSSCRAIYVASLPGSLVELLEQAMRLYVPPPQKD